MYVALEGIDTAGKSTQIELLKSKYPQAIFTCEPGGSELGKTLRGILLQGESEISKEAECLLFLADRAEHIQNVILPNQGKFIVSDRSLISGIAYAKDFDFSTIIALNLFATKGILPKYVVILELTKEELIKRLSLKHQDKIEKKGVEFLLEIQKRMIKACLELKIPYVLIDARESEQAIHQKILQTLK